jgi:hypothetical protein
MDENPDASLFVYDVGNDAFEAHALADLLGFVGSPCKSMQVDFYQRVTGIGTTNKNLQVNAS